MFGGHTFCNMRNIGGGVLRALAKRLSLRSIWWRACAVEALGFRPEGAMCQPSTCHLRAWWSVLFICRVLSTLLVKHRRTVEAHHVLLQRNLLFLRISEIIVSLRDYIALRVIPFKASLVLGIELVIMKGHPPPENIRPNRSTVCEESFGTVVQIVLLFLESKQKQAERVCANFLRKLFVENVFIWVGVLFLKESCS